VLRRKLLPRWPELLLGMALLGSLVFVVSRQMDARARAEARIELLEARARRVEGYWDGFLGSELAPARQSDRAVECEPGPGIEGLHLALHDRLCRDLEAELLSFPPADPEAGRALIEAVGIEPLLGAPQLAPLVIAWYSGVDKSQLDEPTLRLLALATSRALGSFEGLAVEGGTASQAALAGLEPLRSELAGRCEGCAPEAAPLPPPAPTTQLPPSIQGERQARSAAPDREPVDELGALAGTIRRGGEPPAEVWNSVGACGLASLELARMGRIDLLDPILRAAIEGPSATDRMAALHAARTLVHPRGWPQGPARERAAQLGLFQGDEGER
jgi:hypothetical protein